jgi:uncharacterized protein YqgC (DUF456 family)
MHLDAWNIDIDPVWVYYPSAAVLIALCLVAWLTTLVTAPGNWIVVGLVAVFAWLFPEADDRGISWTTVAVLAVVAVLGEVFEFGAGAAGAAKKGASRRSVGLSILGAAVGSILGLAAGAPGLIVGSFVMAVLGGAAGAFAGAYLGETWKGRSEAERVAAGKGAFVGRLWGTVGKLAAGAVMLAIVAWDALL